MAHVHFNLQYGSTSDVRQAVACRNTRETKVGPSPYVEIKNEPEPKLFVDPPLQEGLAIGVVWIQYRVENIRIASVFGPA